MLAERIRFIITDDSGNKTDVWSLRGSLISSLYSRFLPIQMIRVPISPNLLRFHTEPSAADLFSHARPACTSQRRSR